METPTHLYCGIIPFEKTQIKMASLNFANEAWSINFFEFIQTLVGQCAPPEVIEIHPPFDDYCRSIDHFLDVYETFEKSVLDVYPSTLICIENRAGTRYRGGKFLISKVDSLSQLCAGILRRELEISASL